MKKIRFFTLLAVLMVISGTVRAKEAENAPQEKKRIAIMDFQSIGTEKDLGIAIVENLKTDLMNTGRFEIIERNAIDNILKEQSLQISGAIDQDTAVKVGKIAGAQELVMGSVNKIGTTYTINVRFIDVETGVVNDAEKLTGDKKEDIPGMSEDIAKMMLGDKEYRKAIKKKRQKEKKKAEEAEKGYAWFGGRYSNNLTFKGADDSSTDNSSKEDLYDGAELLGGYMLFTSGKSILALEMAFDYISNESEMEGHTEWAKADTEWSLMMPSISVLFKGRKFISPYVGIGGGLCWWKATEVLQQTTSAAKTKYGYTSFPTPFYQYMVGIDVIVMKTVSAGVGMRQIEVRLDEVDYTINGEDEDTVKGNFDVSARIIDMHLAFHF